MDILSHCSAPKDEDHVSGDKFRLAATSSPCGEALRSEPLYADSGRPVLNQHEGTMEDNLSTIGSDCSAKMTATPTDQLSSQAGGGIVRKFRPLPPREFNGLWTMDEVYKVFLDFLEARDMAGIRYPGLSSCVGRSNSALQQVMRQRHAIVDTAGRIVHILESLKESFVQMFCKMLQYLANHRFLDFGLGIMRFVQEKIFPQLLGTEVHVDRDSDIGTQKQLIGQVWKEALELNENLAKCFDLRKEEIPGAAMAAFEELKKTPADFNGKLDDKYGLLVPVYCENLSVNSIIFLMGICMKLLRLESIFFFDKDCQSLAEPDDETQVFEDEWDDEEDEDEDEDEDVGQLMPHEELERVELTVAEITGEVPKLPEEEVLKAMWASLPKEDHPGRAELEGNMLALKTKMVSTRLMLERIEADRMGKMARLLADVTELSCVLQLLNDGKEYPYLSDTLGVKICL